MVGQGAGINCSSLVHGIRTDGRSVRVEERVQAEIDEIALPAPVKELLDPEPDNALKNLLVAGIAGTFCHCPVHFLSPI